MSRTDRIAAIRRLADLLEQCPDLPCPTSVFVSLRDGDDETAVERLRAAEEQIATRGVEVRRESPSLSGSQHAMWFLIDGLTYDASRLFRDTRATEQEAAA